MAAQISARKMREWMVYAELEPFGPPADFWQAGIVASTIANVNRTKKSQKALEPSDFMPKDMMQPPEAQEPQDVSAKVLQTFQDLATLATMPGVRHGE